LADSTGVDFKDIERLHLLGELTKGDCSMFGAWGDALSPTAGIEMLQFELWIGT